MMVMIVMIVMIVIIIVKKNYKYYSLRSAARLTRGRKRGLSAEL